MKLLNASQIRAWDQYTMAHEPIASIDLMERAAAACENWLAQYYPHKTCYIFCGKGNNGGDGLALARLLHHKNVSVKVFILETGSPASADFEKNLERLYLLKTIPVTFIKNPGDFPNVSSEALIIDALFGTGLNRKLEGLAAGLVEYINELSDNTVIAIDLPSGLLCNVPSTGFPVIKATCTLSFQCFKPALLIASNESYFGEVHILDIKLLPGYLNTIETKFHTTDKSIIKKIYRPRRAFSHKGTYGHSLLIAGSYGKMGAAVLCTRACLRSGAGLVTAHVPKNGVGILQISAPEAMCKADKDENIVTEITYDLSTCSAIGIGPGIDHSSITAGLLYEIITSYHKPMVIDADALNILSEHKEWLNILPEGSILTPHPKEFARLFGADLNDFEKIDTALNQAGELGVIIILKGHRTFIATPDGEGYFNTTGNAGMATGGSGDVLTGLLTGLLSQGYLPADAAVLGVYLHGAAGDLAAARYGMEAMIAGDIIEALKEIREL
ncbi:MAG: NAD(P)H-hydrate dehydratase [Niabella sp.]